MHISESQVKTTLTDPESIEIWSQIPNEILEQQYISDREQNHSAAYHPKIRPSPQIPTLPHSPPRVLFDASSSSSEGLRTPDMWVQSSAYYMQSARTLGSEDQAPTGRLEEPASTQAINGYSSLNFTSAASDNFSVLPHDPRGDFSTQFSSGAIANRYHHHHNYDIDLNHQLHRTPATLEWNEERQAASTQLKCWDHGSSET
ncbi:uncharacterized protein N7506_000280 [Penicillium brevicompactum]|uniref:uncharacterized protein n=1 Tax=Penicillium brevicompactum TaxID=5074 RepID=UPI0025410A42|nr:uncharacterized protein N7506_000280 [Penicillium brevicompactum]KAJ5347027.1 hypothetical protein N7506_000280 [Penicillium brevicompactum]